MSSSSSSTTSKRPTTAPARAAAAPAADGPVGAADPRPRPVAVAEDADRRDRPGDLEGPGGSAPDAEDLADDLDAPRQVRLTVARVNPWSVLRLSFLLSVALGVALVVAVAVLWSVLEGMGVFADVDAVIREVVGAESSFDLMQVLGLSRVLSLAVVVAVVDVVLLTAIATLGAVLYNICGALVGGVRLTLTDD